MKRFIFLLRYYVLSVLLFLSLSAFNIVSGQQSQALYQAKNFTSFRPKISILLFGTGIISAPHHSGNLNVSFPYQTIDANGTRTSHVFSGSSNHLLSKNSPEIFFGLDFTRPHFTINFSTGINTTYKGAFYSIGAGANIYLGHWNNTFPEKVKKCTWTIRPLLNFMYFNFSSGELGTISNANTTIYALGSDAGPTFKYIRSIDFHPLNVSSRVVNADKLVVSYKQNALGIQPKIALSTNPYKTHYSFQIFASYFIPLYESSGIVLRQHNNEYDKKHFISGSHSNSIHDTNEITATYNNKTVSSVAFHGNSIFLGVVFGLTFGD